MTELFIRRPVMTSLCMLAILVFGIMGYRQLPVSDLPNVDYPTIQVNAGLPGASPETMAAAVAMPLEKQFSTIPGLDQMTSTSQLGSTSITLQFNLNRDIDAAAQDVNSMIAKTGRDLPQNMPAPPSYQKVNPADSPILYIAISSPTMRLSDVDEYAETLLAQRISMVSGVAQVNVFGASKYAVRVQLDPNKMANLGVGIDSVANAIQDGNVNMPTGTLWGSKQAFTLQATGQLNKAADYAPLIVAYRNGSPIRLEQIAKVFDSVENDKNASWFAGEDHKLARAMILAIQRQPGTNTVEVVDSIKAVLPGLQHQMPAAVKMQIMYDRSQTIRESVNDVKFTLLLALVLVVMVIFLFLRNLWATAIPSLALPFSIVATFAVMYLLDYSLDNMSLMALTLAVGFVVDDAIVMLENIVRHIEMGEPPMKAALNGSKEIGFTIVSMTLSLTAVFLPVLFMGGVVGRLLHEFAVTIAVAILVSGFVSLTLTPMMCSRVLRPHADVRHGRLYNISEKIFDGMLHFYDTTLKIAIHHGAITMLISLGILGLTVYLFMHMPAGFLPSEDQAVLRGNTEAAQGTSYEDMVRHQLQVANAVLTSKDAKYINSFMINVPRGAANQGGLTLRFVPRKLRPHVDQIAQELRPVLSRVPGINTYLMNPPPINIGGQMTKSQYQYTIQGPDTNELYAVAPKLLAELQKNVPSIQDVTSDLLMQNPEVNLVIDRDKASALGVTADQIETAMYMAYGSRQISTIYAPNNAYRVIMEVEPQYQRDAAALSTLYVHGNTGQLVRLDSVAKITRDVGPLTVNHLGQLPAVTVSFNLRPGASLGDAVDQVNAVARKIVPDTISTSFQGAAQAFASSFKGLGVLLIVAILVIYIVLGILYESFVHPITILSGLPSAGVGALLTLKLFHTDLNLYSFVGVIMLVGIVKKNAIMMIDFALEAQRNSAKAPDEAIYQGALVRFRPIMMTTMAALMGTLPIALGLGAGAESRQPLGLAVVGGLLFSQVITLYLTPVFYIYMERMTAAWRRLFGRKQRVAREAAAVATSHD